MPEDRERNSSLEPATAAQTIEGASTGAISSARYWFAPHKKVFEKPGVRLALGAAALLPFVLFLLSNFFQLRGFVDLTASRIDLGLAVILLLALVYVFAFNLPSRRHPTAAIGCVLVLVAAFGLDRLTLSPKVAPPAPPLVVNHPQPVQSLAPNELAAPAAKPTKRSAEKPTGKRVRRLIDLPEEEQMQALHEIDDLFARYELEHGGAPAPREWVRNKLKKARGVDIGPTPSSVDCPSGTGLLVNGSRIGEMNGNSVGGLCVLGSTVDKMNGNGAPAPPRQQ
jgi:hypothetical protein